MAVARGKALEIIMVDEMVFIIAVRVFTKHDSFKSLSPPVVAVRTFSVCTISQAG